MHGRWTLLASLVFAFAACRAAPSAQPTPSASLAPAPVETAADPDIATIPPSYSPALITALCGQIDDVAEIAARLAEPLDGAATPREIAEMRIAGLSGAITAASDARTVAILEVLLDDWRAIAADLAGLNSPAPHATPTSVAGDLAQLDADLAAPAVAAITAYCGAGI
jgi:hypothetical protein